MKALKSSLLLCRYLSYRQASVEELPTTYNPTPYVYVDCRCTYGLDLLDLWRKWVRFKWTARGMAWRMERSGEYTSGIESILLASERLDLCLRCYVLTNCNPLFLKSSSFMRVTYVHPIPYILYVKCGRYSSSDIETPNIKQSQQAGLCGRDAVTPEPNKPS